MLKQQTNSIRYKLASCICLLALFALTACGQKGPIYLPDEEQVTATLENDSSNS